MTITNSSLAPNNNFKIDQIILSLPNGKSLDVTSELLSFTAIETLDGLTTGMIVINNRTNITGTMGVFTGQEMLSYNDALGLN